MRAISLINHLEFEFSGNVLRNALTLDDVDNDGNYELIVGNERGDVVIFKGLEKWQTISNLGFVSCLAVGDILNQNKNCLVVVTGDGWCYIYSSPDIGTEIIEEEVVTPTQESAEVPEESHVGNDTVDGQVLSGESFESHASDSTVATSEQTSSKKQAKKHLELVHKQRIPANAKYILLADVDGDDRVEMVLGLTDRVVRSYRWFDPSVSDNCTYGKALAQQNLGYHTAETSCKLVGLNKWECAKQIGSVTLHHDADGKPTLLIAQPGGTFMRIRFQSNVDDNASETSDSSSTSECLTGSSIDYQFLGISRMRNQNISTEIVGDLKVLPPNDNASEDITSRGAPYAVATLDGTTIMLVQDTTILWAMAVDHQIFALTKLDVTKDGRDELVACSWDGHTYILDQDKNVVRFQLGESVQAFDCGYYTLKAGDPPVACFAYITFHNKILLYHDITLKEMTCNKFKLDLDLIMPVLKGATLAEKEETAAKMSGDDKRRLVEYLLYGVNKSE